MPDKVNNNINLGTKRLVELNSADYPQKVEKLILVDASGLPTNKQPPSIFKMAKNPLLKTLFLYVTPKMLIKKNIG